MELSIALPDRAPLEPSSWRSRQAKGGRTSGARVSKNASSFEGWNCRHAGMARRTTPGPKAVIVLTILLIIIVLLLLFGGWGFSRRGRRV
ncbi:MAG TPA: hypothetical protein VF087_02835 [Solirubrobacteraceae bacterium]